MNPNQEKGEGTMEQGLEEIRTITLAALADGAAEELFKEGLARVLENIDDPNTHWKSKRGITIDIQFITDEDRKAASVVVMSRVKLAEVKPVPTRVHVGRRAGRLIAVEETKQKGLFGADTPLLQSVQGTAKGGGA